MRTDRRIPISISTLFFVAFALQIVWGLVPSASNLVIAEIPVELYIAIRWSISGLFFLNLLFWRKEWPRFRRETIGVAFLGIGGYALASFGSLYGLKIGGVTNFALMSALNPIVSSSVAIVALKEKPLPLFYLALPLCIVGLITLIVGKHEISSWTVALSSTGLIVGGAFLESLAFVYSKRLKSHFTSIQYLAIAQLSAAAFMWMVQVGGYRQFSALHALSAEGWTALGFVAIVACALCYFVLYWLLNHMDGHRLALFDGVHTLSASFFGVLFFHETLNAPMVAGGALLLTGLVIGQIKTVSRYNSTQPSYEASCSDRLAKPQSP